MSVNRESQLCTLCLKDEESIAASNYCEDCEQNLCARCTKFHMRLSSLQGHSIIKVEDKSLPVHSISEVKDTTSESGDAESQLYNENLMRKPSKKINKRCKQHGERIKLFCNPHDQLCCSACIPLNHKFCEDVVHIPSVSIGLAKSQKFTGLCCKLQEIKDTFENLKRQRNDDIVRIANQRDDAIACIRSLRKDLNHLLDKVEEKEIKASHAMFEKQSQYINADIAACEAEISEINTVLKGLSKTTPEMEPQLFVDVHYAKKLVTREEEKIKKTEMHLGSENMIYHPYHCIENWIKSLTAFGRFECGHVLSFVFEYDATSSKDTEQMNNFFYGSLSLSNDRTVLTDSMNNKVKIMDTNLYEIKDAIEASERPFGVCAIGENELAVGMTTRKIAFIDLNQSQVNRRFFATEDACRGIAYHKGEIFAVCGGEHQLKEGHGVLCIYSVTGELQQKFQRGGDGNYIFAAPKNIVVSDNDDMIVTDRMKGVVTLNRGGQIKSIFSDEDLKSAYGICKDGIGGVFVTGKDSNTVIQLGLDGQKKGVVLNHSDGLRKPISVAFDVHTSRLTVTMEMTNKVKVFELSAKQSFYEDDFYEEVDVPVYENSNSDTDDHRISK